VIECSRFVALVPASSLSTRSTGGSWERRPPPESVWMHVRAPHGRVAFGLGRSRAADPAVPTVAADDLDGSLAAGGGGCCCWGRRRLLLGEEAAAAAGGGGCGCCGRMLVLREVAACLCCRWKEHCKDGRGLPAAGTAVARRMAGSRRPRSESAAWAGCVAGPDCPFVDTYLQCAGHEPEPVGGERLGGTFQSSFVPLPGLGHAHYAEPVGGKRPGGTCQSSFVPLPGLGHAHYADPVGVSGRAARVSLPSSSYHYPGWAMLITPSPLGVSGRAVRVSLSSCHYPGWAMLITPSPLGVSGRAVRVSLPSCHYPG
jgi:hypothetical protein